MQRPSTPSTSSKRSSRTSEKLKIKERVQDATVSSVSTNSIDNEKKHGKSPVSDYNPPDSTTTIIDKSESLRTTDFNNFLKPQASVSSKIRSDCDNIDIIINRIVQWPIQWLMEQSNTDISPPVSGDIQPSPVLTVYPHYEAYAKTMTPLVLLELWQFIYQSACNKEDARYVLLLNHIDER